MSDEDEPLDDEGMADDWAAALEEQEIEETAESQEFEELVDEAMPSSFDSDNPDLEVILDIPVSISMVVGSTQINIRNLLQLNQGSVIELDRLAGEPLDVLVNNTPVSYTHLTLPTIYSV